MWRKMSAEWRDVEEDVSEGKGVFGKMFLAEAECGGRWLCRGRNVEEVFCGVEGVAGRGKYD